VTDLCLPELYIAERGTWAPSSCVITADCWCVQQDRVNYLAGQPAAAIEAAGELISSCSILSIYKSTMLRAAALRASNQVRDSHFWSKAHQVLEPDLACCQLSVCTRRYAASRTWHLGSSTPSHSNSAVR
jgi:hypothetical protein